MSVLTNSGWTKRARRIAFGGALGLAVLAALIPAGAQAQDDDDDDKKSGWNLDKKLLNDLMRNLGLRNGNESQIEYRERSPLVIPPSKNYPRPSRPAPDGARLGRSIPTSSARRKLPSSARSARDTIRIMKSAT